MWPKAMRRPGADRAPPYFNYGFVAIPAGFLPAIRDRYWDASRAAEELSPGSMYRSQVALTMAIEAAGLPHRTVAMRYNFANDTSLEALYVDELRQARVVHLLRRNHLFDKQAVFADLDALRGFAASGWETAGALERARAAIAEVLPEIEAKAVPEGLVPTGWAW